jgi:hypothetical protein
LRLRDEGNLRRILIERHRRRAKSDDSAARRHAARVPIGALLRCDSPIVRRRSRLLRDVAQARRRCDAPILGRDGFDLNRHRALAFL